MVQAQDNIGRATTYSYDEGGRLIQSTDPARGVTKYVYDANDQMTSITDARGNLVVTNTYDDNGRVSTQQHADGGLYQFAYTEDANGNILQTAVTDPRNTVETLAFQVSGYFTGGDIAAETVASNTPLAQTTSYSWDPASNLLQSTTDALGRQTAYTYDSLGNQTSVTYLAGTAQAVTTASVYDPAFSEITSITDPLQHTTTFAYDAQGNLTTITNTLQQSVAFAHNPAGQITSITPPAPAGVTQLGYAGPDLTSMTDALGNVVRVTADGAGRVVSKALPMGQTTFYQYDALDDLLRVQDALGNATALAYDPNGNLQSVADALLHSTAYMYDVRNQRIKRTDPLQNAETSTYDLNGNLLTFADRKAQATSYTYDALDRIQQVQYADHSTITYTYDAGNRITQIVDSLSGTITRQYDGLDRLTLEQTPQGTVAYTYDAAGRRTTMTVSGQANPVAYSYDNANRLTQVTQGLNVVSIGYDAAGRRASVALPNGIVAAYTYDLASELTGITYTNGASVIGGLTYAYDQNGNRTQVGGTLASTGLPAALSGATYNVNNQLQQWGSAVFSYDLNGNMTGDGTNAYAWDARNQLASITGAVLVAPQYDALGRRTLNPSGETLLYDGSNIVQEQSNGSANINLLTGLGVDERFVWSDSAGNQSYLTDGLNSTVAMTNAGAGVTAQYTYEPFGGTNNVGSSSNNLEYTGRENDGTGLYYYRARYYSPQLQRFVSEDPIGFLGRQWNLYAYVADNPLSYTDPTGGVIFPPGRSYPPPTGPDGQPLPPPIPLPPGKNGQPNSWRPVQGSNERPKKWCPRHPVPSPKGGQPGASWDPEFNHWDYDDGNGDDKRFLPDGTPVDHDNNPLAPDERTALAAAVTAIVAVASEYWWVPILALP